MTLFVAEAAWFVVFCRSGRLSPSIYHGYLPSWATDKHAKEMGVVSVTRLDTLEHAEFWVDLPLTSLMDFYREGSLGNPKAVERQRAYEAANERHPLLFGYTETTINVEVTETTIIGQWPVAPGFEGL